MRLVHGLTAMGCALLCACGGDDDGGSGGRVGRSGLSADQALGELSAAEVRQYCEWEVGLIGTGDEMDCGDAGTAVIGQGDVEECVDDSEHLFTDCPATVQDAEDCLYEALADPCAPRTPDDDWEACAWVHDCVLRNSDE